MKRVRSTDEYRVSPSSCHIWQYLSRTTYDRITHFEALRSGSEVCGEFEQGRQAISMQWLAMKLNAKEHARAGVGRVVGGVVSISLSVAFVLHAELFRRQHTEQRC